MKKSMVPVEPNLDVMRQNGCQIQIQRPKNIENDHTHHLCISKLFFCNAVLCMISFLAFLGAQCYHPVDRSPYCADLARITDICNEMMANVVHCPKTCQHGSHGMYLAWKNSHTLLKILRLMLLILPHRKKIVGQN